MMSVASSTTPGIGRELVHDAVNLHRRNRRALDRGEQHPAQGIADRGAEAALEWLGVESAESLGQRLALELEPLGSLKTFPQHVMFPFATGPQRGLQTCQ